MSNFKEPDRKAPRYRPQRDMVYSNSFFKEFYEKHPGLKHLSKAKIRLIVREFNKKIVEECCLYRDGVELPEGLGFIFVASIKMKDRTDLVDYAKSIKYKKKILHKNHDTNGYVGKIMYTVVPAKYKIKDASIWSLVASRNFKNAMKRVYSSNYNRYHNITGMKPSALYHKIRVV